MTQTAADLSPSAQEAIAEALNQCVAETAVSTMLAQNFHWNVTGMSFGPLHALFQTIYEDHFTAQDDLAERIRALNAHAEGTLAGMLKRSKVNVRLALGRVIVSQEMSSQMGGRKRKEESQPKEGSPCKIC